MERRRTTAFPSKPWARIEQALLKTDLLLQGGGFSAIIFDVGIANMIVTPDLYDRNRLVVTRSKFLLAAGKLQDQDGVIHMKAIHLNTLSDLALEMQSHDFH